MVSAGFVDQCACGLTKLVSDARCPKCRAAGAARAAAARLELEAKGARDDLVKMDPPCACGNVLAWPIAGGAEWLCLECGELWDW